MERIILGGVELTGDCITCDVKRPFPYVSPTVEHIAGRDGYVLKNADIMHGSISFRLVFDGDEEERRTVIRRLAPVLLSKQPMKLSFLSDMGLYYTVIPNGEADLSEFVRCGSLVVSMLPLEAAMFGARRTVTVPSGGSVSLNVGGTYRTLPVIEADAVRNSSSLVWGVRLDEGDYIHIATGSASARKVSIDCAERTVALQGAASIITLDSDWLEFEPGRHTLRMDNGTGAARVSWRERWL